MSWKKSINFSIEENSMKNLIGNLLLIIHLDIMFHRTSFNKNFRKYIWKVFKMFNKRPKRMDPQLIGLTNLALKIVIYQTVFKSILCPFFKQKYFLRIAPFLHLYVLFLFKNRISYFLHKRFWLKLSVLGKCSVFLEYK